MAFTRRHFLETAAFAGIGIAAPAWSAGRTFTPEQFGARGDGVSNDTDAFERLSAAVMRQGGGEIVLRKTTYIVGRQLSGHAARTGYAFEPARILDFVGLRGALTIRGNGARLKCAPGLRYGTFNARTGAKTVNTMPYTGGGELASPYRAMIRVENCLGPVDISDIELDGNVEALRIGGQYGDTGWQIPAVGLALANNRSSERIARVYAHHHALDGIHVDGLDGSRGSAAASVFQDVRCEYNGRQGLSLVGGRGYAFTRCKFNHTGRAGIASAPGAGVDIEAEAGKRVRDVTFTECEFSNNFGVGLVADNGDTEAVSFTRSTFVGTTSWAAWPDKPRMRFQGCTFVGPIVRPFGDKQPDRATQFHDCTFRDDPRLSPTGQVYGGTNTDRPIADLPGNENVLFHRCKFLLTHRAVLPWSVNVIYSDCTMAQRSPTFGYPRGFYVGRNTIDGNVTISGSMNRGDLIIRGKALPRGRL
jgi:hypothetical protein